MTNRTTEVPRLSWTQVCARRLDRHALSAPSHDARPADIVGTMCGAHAQVLSAAELSIGLRLVGVARLQREKQQAVAGQRAIHRFHRCRTINGEWLHRQWKNDRLAQR